MENNILFGYEIAYISMNFSVIQISIIKEPNQTPIDIYSVVLFYFV